MEILFVVSKHDPWVEKTIERVWQQLEPSFMAQAKKQGLVRSNVVAVEVTYFPTREGFRVLLMLVPKAASRFIETDGNEPSFDALVENLGKLAEELAKYFEIHPYDARFSVGMSPKYDHFGVQVDLLIPSQLRAVLTIELD